MFCWPPSRATGSLLIPVTKYLLTIFLNFESLWFSGYTIGSQSIWNLMLFILLEAFKGQQDIKIRRSKPNSSWQELRKTLYSVEAITFACSGSNRIIDHKPILMTPHATASDQQSAVWVHFLISKSVLFQELYNRNLAQLIPFCKCA